MGISPQIARGKLPNELKTEIVMTCNFREWMHFCHLRMGVAAHPQIRPIAKAIYNVLFEQAPNVFAQVPNPKDFRELVSCNRVVKMDMTMFSGVITDADGNEHTFKEGRMES